MNDKALTITNDQIKEEGHRIKTLLPGGNKLTDNQAYSLGFVGRASDANAWRGEIYGYQDRNGNFRIIEGYKLQVRWAKEQSEYDDNYFALTDEEMKIQRLPDTSMAYRCRILRQDKRSGIRVYMDLGATFSEAVEEVSTSAIGVVDAKDMKNAPPKGWSWAQVAKKRALKNALNLAYAMPSLQQLARKFFDVDGTQTESEDWEGVGIYKTDVEQRQAAKVNAWGRKAKAKRDQLTPDQLHAESQANIDLMRGTVEDEETALGEEPEREEVEEVEEGVIEEAPPTSDVGASGNGGGQAKIGGGFDWGKAARQLVEACPAYALENGQPNMQKIVTTAWAVGIKQIHKGNIGDTLAALSDNAGQLAEDAPMPESAANQIIYDQMGERI
jgi:hypothetical protein